MATLVDALFATVPEAVFVVASRTTKILRWNGTAERLLGFSEEHLTGQRLLDLHPAEDRDGMEAYFRAAPGEGSAPSSPLICRLRPRTTEPVPCELFLQKSEHEGKSVLLAVYRDITARLQAEEDINLRNVAIGSVRSGVSIADARQPDLPLIYVNEGFARITGYSPKEAVGRSCRFLQGDDRDQPGLSILREALTKGQPCEVLLRNYRKDGEAFWNELLISPVFNEARELTHFVGIQLDVTERVQAREQLLASAARFRSLAESVQDLIMRYTPDGLFDYVSPASQRVLGFEADELQALPRHTLIHREDWPAVVAATEDLLAGNSPQQYTARWRSENGSWRWLEHTDSLVDLPEAEEQRRIVSVARDVTARKKADEEVQRALAAERETNQIKTDFIRTVSHEFRTPMTGVAGSAELLRAYYDKMTPDKRTSHWANIQRSLRRMTAMLDDVLFLSRSDAARVDFTPEVLDLNAWFEDYLEDLALAHGAKRLQWKTFLPADEKRRADPDLLDRILGNLVSNALKYSDPHTVVAVALKPTVEKGDERIEIRVRDHGIGIPAADQAALFEAFSRAGNVGTRQGTGLGLNIALRAVELHGGSVTFESQEGVGTTFTTVLHAPVAH